MDKNEKTYFLMKHGKIISFHLSYDSAASALMRRNPHADMRGWEIKLVKEVKFNYCPNITP